MLDRRAFLGRTGAALALNCSADAADTPAAKGGQVLGQPDAARAGQSVLAGGGNAVDAAVTAALVAGVVDLANCGPGGYGGHMVIAQPRGKIVSIDFNSTAPAAAKPDMFAVDETGRVRGDVHSHGWLAAGVPGTLAGLQLALDRHGTIGFKKAAAPAIRIAREGIAISKRLATSLARAAPALSRDPGTAKRFLEKGKPLSQGARYRNPELADMLQTLAERGSVESFYQGDIARKIAAAFKAGGGLVTEKDLAGYRAREVEPLTLEWRGYTVHTAPLTAGGLTVLQALATLKALGWEKWKRTDPARTQARLEALRIAWDDRLTLLGDPDQVTVPIERLLSEKYARESAARVRAAVEAKKPVEAAGDGRGADGTVHLTAVDASGLMVALTLTHGEFMGAQVTVPGLGLILGHGMSRFDPRPGRANSVGPGKRPLHNMCPTVVTREGRPILALGAVGGRRIRNTLFGVLIARVGEGRTLADAVAAPRLHSEGDRRVAMEQTWPADDVKRLKEVGYTVRTGGGAVLNAIEREPSSGKLRSAAR
jgi:gamma-glutamyltranspeptidase/glutathione hydrolase